jgi:hypothetical protein
MWVIRENAAKTKAAQREAAFFMTGGKISYFNENLNLKNGEQAYYPPQGMAAPDGRAGRQGWRGEGRK